MRRGLMSWSREEVPAAVLDERVGRLQAAMKQRGWGAALAYTSFAEPAAVHWLTNFTPYWSEALLLVPPAGMPVLLAALTPRVHGWIREVSHLGDVVSAPRLGQAARKLLEERGAGRAVVGVIGLDALPASVAGPLFEGWTQDRIADAGEVFARLRQPADAVELALADCAREIGQRALDGMPAQAAGSNALAGAVEALARSRGAEETLHRVAPDLRRSGGLLRLEGELALGDAYAVELSLAYKGTWVRLGRSVARGAAPASWRQADAWFEASLRGLAQSGGSRPQLPDGARQGHWTLESCTGAQPLSVAASSRDGAPQAALRSGMRAVFSAHAEFDDGHWFRAAPVTLA